MIAPLLNAFTKGIGSRENGSSAMEKIANLNLQNLRVQVLIIIRDDKETDKEEPSNEV